MAKRKSIACGAKFNILTLLSNAPDIGGRHSALFRCDCGAEKVMLVSNVLGGKSKSCGCVGRKKTIERSTKHGHAKRGEHSDLYEVWAGMMARCTKPYRPDYHRYGGRGIRVCDSWTVFENFVSDMAPRPEGMILDRFPDSNGNYEPGNCRWATPKEQANNRRSNVMIDHEGRRQNIESWAQELGIARDVIESRLRRGYPVYAALNPVLHPGHRPKPIVD